jgi:hypothetical protein
VTGVSAALVWGDHGLLAALGGDGQHPGDQLGVFGMAQGGECEEADARKLLMAARRAFLVRTLLRGWVSRCWRNTPDRTPSRSAGPS